MTIKDDLKRSLTIEGEVISKLKEELNLVKVEELVKLIGAKKGKVVVSGCGTSGVAAKKVVHSLNCIECPAVYLNPTDGVHGALGILQPEDVLILISKGGNTQELLRLIPACQVKQASLIGIGENSDSVIGKESDLFITIKVEREPDPFNMLATASTLAVIAMFDSVCVALMTYTNYTEEQFGVIHPGGAVGDRLLNN